MTQYLPAHPLAFMSFTCPSLSHETFERGKQDAPVVNRDSELHAVTSGNQAAQLLPCRITRLTKHRQHQPHLLFWVEILRKVCPKQKTKVLAGGLAG